MNKPNLTAKQIHSKADKALRAWSAKPVRPTFARIDEEVKGETHTLRAPECGAWTIQVSFTELKGEDNIRIRSTNWRCEHEPSGVFSKADARKFYQSLLDLGMERVTS